MARSFTRTIWDAKNKASGQKPTFVTDDNRECCSCILWGSAKHFQMTGIPTIKHIQNIITTSHESNGVSSIQAPTVAARKGEGEDTMSDREILQITQLRNLKMVPSVNKRSGLMMRPIFSWMITWINKTGTTGVQEILISVSSYHCIQKGSWCGVPHRQREQLVWYSLMVWSQEWSIMSCWNITLTLKWGISTWQAGTGSCRIRIVSIELLTLSHCLKQHLVSIWLHYM